MCFISDFMQTDTVIVAYTMPGVVNTEGVVSPGV